MTKPADPDPRDTSVPATLDELERPLLDDARRLLEEAAAPVGRIIRVYDDAILFVNRAGRPMTAWKWRIEPSTPAGAVREWVTYESGFRISPSQWLIPREFQHLKFIGEA